MVEKVPELAIILAGGEGTRLRPLTEDTPKPLIPVNGKPVLAYILEELEREGIREVLVSIGYKGEKIVDFLKEVGSKRKIRITYVQEEKALGTGGALRFALKKITKDYKDVFVINGDDLFTLDLASMYELHLKEEAYVTLAVKRVDDISGYGVLEISEKRITRFIEKPDTSTMHDKSGIINIGKYIFSSQALNALPNLDIFPLEKGFLEGAVSTEKIMAFTSEGIWMPIDTPERYKKAIETWR